MLIPKRLLAGMRKAGLSPWLDKLNFLYHRQKFRKENAAFRREHPRFALPPDYMLYEAYKLHYQEYYEDGRTTAGDIVNMLKPFVDLNDATVMEWGCGPARIVRHLPELLPHAKVIASDYNRETIAWCKANISGVDFRVNELYPGFQLATASLNAIYAISVFTHLAADNHILWMEELHRVLKPGGVLLFTTQGQGFLGKLTNRERLEFARGRIVVRGQVKEGHRSFSAFHPESYIHNLLTNRFTLLMFTPGARENWGIGQDTWVVQKV